MSASTITLPPEIRSKAAWYGTDLAAEADWMERLSDAQIREVERAVRALEKSDLATISPHDVHLPTLAPRLQTMLDEVLNGRGFVLLRGLPVERWSRRHLDLVRSAQAVQL